jgi:hypothetical protein
MGMTGGIDGVGGGGLPGGAAPVGRGLGRGRAARPEEGGFRLAEGNAVAPEPSGIGAAEAAPLLGVMLALQEAGGDRAPGRAGDRAARRHAGAMLAELRALQLALLGREAGDVALERLASLARHLPAAEDAGLAATLASLALRARIELARREGETKTA